MVVGGMRANTETSRSSARARAATTMSICFLSPGVQAISLPDATRNYDNVEAVVTGWGALSSRGQASKILQKVEVRTMSNKQCRNNYRTGNIKIRLDIYM